MTARCSNYSAPSHFLKQNLQKSNKIFSFERLKEITLPTPSPSPSGAGSSLASPRGGMEGVGGLEWAKVRPGGAGGFSGACSVFFYLIRFWLESISGVLIGGSVLDGLDEGLRDGTEGILGLEVLAQVGMRLLQVCGILEHACALQVVETAVFATELASTLVENGADSGCSGKWLGSGTG